MSAVTLIEKLKEDVIAGEITARDIINTLDEIRELIGVSMELPDAQRFADLVVSAFEGGSNYWIAAARQVVPDVGNQYDSIRYSDPQFWLDGGYYIIYPDGDNKSYNLTLDSLHGAFNSDKLHHKHRIDFITENDDADTADAFVQIALFGELVYG